jgi:ribosomal protein S18 acetylase RimI-like enzyme
MEIDAAMQIRYASTSDDIAAMRALFEEYAVALSVDLCFQGFAEELAQLPGSYARPRGRLMLAWANDRPAGCVALRPISDSVCEMKRLYVRPAFRRQGAGKQLAECVIAEARQIGFSSMCLDTLPEMTAATRLYESLGFVRRDSYYNTPLQETIFMELEL